MFLNSLSPEQREQFIEDRVEHIKEKMNALREKIEAESNNTSAVSQLHVYTYLENHLKAELNWLKSLKKGEVLTEAE
jgi:hypothetical protein